MGNEQLILVVNSNKNNAEILSKFLGKYGYAAVSYTSLEELERGMAGNEHFSLALVDISGFSVKIWEKIKGLQERNIPFIIVSPKQVGSIKLQVEGMKAGARAVLEKPLSSEHLLGLIKEMLS